MVNFPCYWNYTKEFIVDLDVFGQQVLEDLWTEISEEYPRDESESDPIVMERQMHETFVAERSHLYRDCIQEAAQQLSMCKVQVLICSCYRSKEFLNRIPPNCRIQNGFETTY
jgi:hypothetical protein